VEAPAGTFERVGRGRHGKTGRSAAAVATVAVLGIAACGDDGGSVSSGDGGDGRGEALYQESCAECHGADLRGTDRGPSHLSVVYAPDHHPDSSFRAAVASGAIAHHWAFGDMPPVPGLTDDEVDAIIAFVREQQERHGLERYPPP
jgi:mono/diheme cytochrome c family protein